MESERKLPTSILTKFIKSKHDKEIELNLFEYSNNNKNIILIN